MTGRPHRGARLLLLVALVLPAPARPQEAGPAAPARIETAAPDAPIRMLADDARETVRRLGRAAPAATTSAPRTGGSETVRIEGPSGENQTPRFVFRDVTERPAPEVKTPVPPDVRRANVEAVRQSLARAKDARRR
jgi:hypothetical protein